MFFFIAMVSTTMESHIYKVMKFNKASEVLRDYLNQKEIISLLERGGDGSLNQNETKIYNDIMDSITNNKNTEEELKKEIRSLTRHIKDDDTLYDSCEN